MPLTNRLVGSAGRHLLPSSSRWCPRIAVAGSEKGKTPIRAPYNTYSPRPLVTGVGCSHWQHPHCRDYTKLVERDQATSVEGSATTRPVETNDANLVDFMEDGEGDFENMEYEESSFSMDQVDPSNLSVDPTEIQRPKLPRSIKKLNKALGRKNIFTVPDHELIEQFVRGRGPGGQAINKTNSSVSLIHVPTGIRIQSQPTRSREQNRIAARHILSERLDELRGKGLYTPTDAPVLAKPAKDPASMTENQLRREGKRQQEVALADAYTKTELRAAKERARKANRAKKHRQKKRRMEESGENVEPT